MFTPSHSCSKPIKPYEFTSEWQLDNFKRDVDYYRECINRFVEEQNDAVNTHQNAAQDAIQDWNDFVSWELN
ncbi:hypothetical protein MSG37_13450 [Shewanella sp. 1CM18E]|uniref:hypothetical protein n=1 Tax=Shewanella sp. 1CM18E TaxID=2929169 RepID=UPI0020BE8823|nr:hypothetical protein [Shewanella sp. 1CM18E]MCK8045890.1 hypothetical protein [Shewanella sp. 1CM18E]